MEVDHNKIRCNGQTSLTPPFTLPLILGDNEDKVVGVGWLGARKLKVPEEMDAESPRFTNLERACECTQRLRDLVP